MSLSERELLRVIAALEGAPDVVMVGGQAVYYWYQKLAPDNPQLRKLPVPTSKDVDFQCTAAAAEKFAKRLPGDYLPAGFEANTVSSALVRYTDAAGAQHDVDSIIAPHGLTARDVQAKSVPVTFDVDGAAVSIRVTNPLHCLQSRVANVVGLDRADAHSMNQLEASIACLGALFEMLAASDVRKALNLAERVCEVAATSSNGLRVFKQHGVDVLNALAMATDLATLPLAFRQTRYPQMLDYVRKKRRA